MWFDQQLTVSSLNINCHAATFVKHDVSCSRLALTVSKMYSPMYKKYTQLQATRTRFLLDFLDFIKRYANKSKQERTDESIVKWYTPCLKIEIKLFL